MWIDSFFDDIRCDTVKSFQDKFSFNKIWSIYTCLLENKKIWSNFSNSPRKINLNNCKMCIVKQVIAEKLRRHCVNYITDIILL